MNDDRDDAHNDNEEADDESPSAPAQSTNDDTNEDTLRNAVGAYLLDALPESERSAFESFLARSPDAQEELQQLAPVVALLPKLLDVDVISDDAPPPSAELRANIMQVIQSEQSAPSLTDEALAPDSEVVVTPAPERARVIRTAPEPSGSLAPARAQGRIRSGIGGAQTGDAKSSPITTISRFPTEWLAAAILLVVAVGAIVWALALQSRIDSKTREINAQSAEIAELRRNANATAYTLSASESNAADAGGTLLFSLKDQIGVLYVHSLPKLDSDQVYQLWYLDENESPIPGETFKVDRNGNGAVVVASDTPSHDGIALTAEPAGGSEAPTSAILLQGNLGGVAG